MKTESGANLAAGRLAERIARELWPDLGRVTTGSPLDLAGADALRRGGGWAQVKLDRLISDTRNLFWEIAKRGDGSWNAYGSSEWHGATSAHEYVYVTRFAAYRIRTEELVLAAAGRDLVIRPRGTSAGFLIPLAAVNYDRRQHDEGFYE